MKRVTWFPISRDRLKKPPKWAKMGQNGLRELTGCQEVSDWMSRRSRVVREVTCLCRNQIT